MYEIKRKYKELKMGQIRKLLYKYKTLLNTRLEDYKFLALIANVLSSAKRQSDVLKSCLITSVNKLRPLS